LEDFKKLGERYSLAIKTLDDIKRDLSEAVIKYVIANSYTPKKCTESAIAEALGIPRSTIRNVLSDLTKKEPILEFQDYGTIKPYKLRGIGYAIDRNYLSFSKEEIKLLLGAKQLSKRLSGVTIGYPQVQMDLPNGKTVVRYRGPAADLCLERLIQRFYGYMATKIDKKISKIYGEETSRELDLLAPEMKAFEKTVTPQTIASFPGIGSILSKDLLDLVPETSIKEIRDYLKESMKGQLQYVQKKLEIFENLLEEMGYDGVLAYFKDHIPSEERYIGSYPPFDYRFRNEYLWATTLALREGCSIAEKIGVDSEFLDKLITKIKALDLALEEKYQGKEKEKQSVIEWYNKRTN
jgi:hypothetical protein